MYDFIVSSDLICKACAVVYFFLVVSKEFISQKTGQKYSWTSMVISKGMIYGGPEFS